VNWHKKGKPFWILILMKQYMMGGWQWHQLAKCKTFTPRSRQITMTVPRHSVLYRPDALPTAITNSAKALKAIMRSKTLLIF